MAASPPPGATTGTVAPTGNALLDGLMSGYRWTASTVSYSFPSADVQFDGVADGVVDYGGDGSGIHTQVTLVSEAQRELTRLVLEGRSVGGTSSWFGVTALTKLSIVEVGGFGQGAGSAAGDIRLTQSDLPNTAFAAYPDAAYADGRAGDIWFGTTAAGGFYDLRFPILGNYQAQTLMHEVGHALGLKHGHESDGGFSALPASMDSLDFTIMTYRSYLGEDPIVSNTGDFPQSWMMVDIMALQRLYGANYGHQAGDTTYAWSPGSGQTFIDGIAQVAPNGTKVFLTIWDGGGIDTYDMSDYATRVSIDLRPGRWSVTAEDQRAVLDMAPPLKLALGNVYNALLYRGNEASLIENATGGTAGDAIRGNVAANLLRGGDGGDSLSGDAGGDTLLGEAGADTMTGGAGNDSFAGGTGDDVYMVDGWQADTVSEIGGGGYDRVLSGWDWTLDEGFERLSLTGTLDAWGFGNAAANRLDGNASANLLEGRGGNDRLFGAAGADTLVGGLGADRLDGGAGADVFLFQAMAERGDIIALYNGVEDRIEVSAAGFRGGLVKDTILTVADGRFAMNTTGLAESPAGIGQFIWETDAEMLWWDRDGMGGLAALRLATLPGAISMGSGEIAVIA
jgi:serralysin